MKRGCDCVRCDSSNPSDKDDLIHYQSSPNVSTPTKAARRNTWRKSLENAYFVIATNGLDLPFTETQPLQIVRAELADLVQTKYQQNFIAGVCHSDLSVINGDRPRPTPVALGHEGVGEVVKTGPGSSDLKIGQRVSMVFVPSCGHCDCCAEGRPALCEPGLENNTNGSLLSGAKRISVNGEVINHHLGISCFSDYAVSHRRSLVPVDSDLDPTIQAVFGCAVLTGCGAVLNTAKMHIGERVAIVGLGGVGLSALLGAHAGGARQIIAIDANPDKEELARELGADHFVNARDPDAIDQVKTYHWAVYILLPNLPVLCLLWIWQLR